MILSRLFAPKRPTPSQSLAEIPKGQRIYAVGDIHGRLDLVEQLVTQIDADDGSRGAAQSQVIFLGDLIDRGPDSAQVIELLLRLRDAGQPFRFLLGNHEEVFLKALGGDTKALSFFARIGGRETILSYGVSEQEYRDSDWDELRDILLAKVPPRHIAFLEAFEDLIVIGGYAFVHAGIRPGRDLASQKISDLRWIREEFIQHTAPLEKVVVHGHTISTNIEAIGHRIGIDTGAYASGKLTAMGFEGSEKWTIEAIGSPAL